MSNTDELLKQQTPQTIEVIEVISNEDEILHYTQKTRQRIVQRLMNKTHDQLEGSDKTMLLMALDGMDRSAMGRKRLKTDEKVGASQAMAAALIAQVLAAPGALRAHQGISNRPIPQLPADIPEPILVPGELEQTVSQMDFDTFMARSSEEESSQSEQ
jgi:hypothetical protein